MLSGLGWAKEEFKTLWTHRTCARLDAGGGRIGKRPEKEPALEQPWAAAQAPPSRATRCRVEPLAGGESPGKVGGAAVWGLPGWGPEEGREEEPASAEPAGSPHPVGGYKPRLPRASGNCPALPS